MPQREGGVATFTPATTDSIDQSREARLAQPGDIAHAKHISKGAKRYWIGHLCKYRNNSNRAWPRLATAMADLVTSERSIQNYRRELIETNWICLPEGDAGGRRTDGSRGGLVIHLHPDGMPCSLPHVELKQCAAQSKGAVFAPLSGPITHFKGAELAPLRVQKTTSKGAKNDSAIRKELLKEPFKEEPSTTTAALDAELVEPETAADDDGGPISIVKDFADPIFSDLERMCDPPVSINSVGRARILRASYAFGFSLEQLRYAWRRDARFQTGGLIMLAENWAAETAHLNLPTCLSCEDTGTLVLHQKLVPHASRGLHSRQATRDAFDQLIYGSGLFCSCAIGVKAAEVPATQTPPPTEPTEESAQKASNLAEQRRRAEEEAAEKKRLETERLADLVARHVCVQCAAARGRQQHGAWHLCLGCLGTGQHWTPEEHQERKECGSCRGTGKVHDGRQGYNVTSKKPPWMIVCTKCHGSQH